MGAVSQAWVRRELDGAQTLEEALGCIMGWCDGAPNNVRQFLHWEWVRQQHRFKGREILREVMP